MHSKIYVNRLRRLSRRKLYKAKGTVRIKSTQIRCFLRQSDGRLDLVTCKQRHLKLSYIKGGSDQAHVQSDQMVLVMARQEAGPR
jgi:hypothetical protein